MNAQFEAGKTYTTRSIGDADCIISVTIDKRTAKTVTAKVQGQMQNFRIFVRDGIECIRPWGNYSMCPTLQAN
jgi:hypothetical protein